MQDNNNLDLPDHLKFIDESIKNDNDNHYDDDYFLDKFNNYKLYNINHFYNFLNDIFGIKDCASCRKWWLALFMGASVGINLAYGPTHAITAILVWILYWIFIEKYSHKNDSEHFLEIRNMDIIQIADQCGSDDALYVPYFSAIILSILMWLPMINMQTIMMSFLILFCLYGYTMALIRIQLHQ